VTDLIDRKLLEHLLRKLEAAGEAEFEVILVGGSAVLVLVSDALATRDIDVLWTDGLRLLSQSLGEEGWSTLKAELRLSTRSDPFEIHLPPDWRDRARLSPEFSVGKLSVFTPAPEDLAVMKLFRFRAKDAEDIRNLASGPFDRGAFRRAFVSTLPFGIGDPRWHAQSFVMLWNGLYPESPIELDEIVREAHISA